MIYKLNIPLTEFLQDLGVTPSVQTQVLMGGDPNQSIEDCFGEEKAADWEESYGMPIRNLPVGFMLRECVLTDLKECGYKSLGYENPKLSSSMNERIVREHGEENIIVTSERTISGVTQIGSQEYPNHRHYFLKPEGVILA